MTSCCRQKHLHIQCALPHANHLQDKLGPHSRDDKQQPNIILQIQLFSIEESKGKQRGRKQLWEKRLENRLNSKSKKPNYSYGHSCYSRRCQTGESYRPLSVEHLAMLRYGHPSTPDTQNGSCKKGKSERLRLCSHTFSWRQLPAEHCCLRLSSPSPSSPLQQSSCGHPLPCAWNFTAASASEKYR